MNSIKVINYCTRANKEPFADWLDEQDNKTQIIILKRIAKIRTGYLGDCKQLENGEGVWELRIHFGPGYRIYFGKTGKTIVILLLGGDKGSQNRDIIKAKRYWSNYKESL